MANLQKKDFSKQSERSSWASKSCSKYFWHMLWILFRFSNIRAIEWRQFENHYSHRLDFMTGNWPCYRFLRIKAWNACRIFYSFGLTMPLRVSIFFEGSNKKSASTVLSGMFWRIKNIYTSWSYLLKWRNAPKKTEKKQNCLPECSFEIIGFRCCLNLDIGQNEQNGQNMIKNVPEYVYKYRFRSQKGVKIPKYFFRFWKYVLSAF